MLERKSKSRQKIREQIETAKRKFSECRALLTPHSAKSIDQKRDESMLNLSVTADEQQLNRMQVRRESIQLFKEQDSPKAQQVRQQQSLSVIGEQKECAKSTIMQFVTQILKQNNNGEVQEDQNSLENQEKQVQLNQKNKLEQSELNKLSNTFVVQEKSNQQENIEKQQQKQRQSIIQPAEPPIRNLQSPATVPQIIQNQSLKTSSLKNSSQSDLIRLINGGQPEQRKMPIQPSRLLSSGFKQILELDFSNQPISPPQLNSPVPRDTSSPINIALKHFSLSGIQAQNLKNQQAFNTAHRLFHQSYPVVSSLLVIQFVKMSKVMEVLKFRQKVKQLNLLNIGMIAFRLNRQQRQKERVKEIKADHLRTQLEKRKLARLFAELAKSTGLRMDSVVEARNNRRLSKQFFKLLKLAIIQSKLQKHADAIRLAKLFNAWKQIQLDQDDESNLKAYKFYYKGLQRRYIHLLYKAVAKSKRIKFQRRASELRLKQMVLEGWRGCVGRRMQQTVGVEVSLGRRTMQTGRITG